MPINDVSDREDSNKEERRRDQCPWLSYHTKLEEGDEEEEIKRLKSEYFSLIIPWSYIQIYTNEKYKKLKLFTAIFNVILYA